MRAKKKAKNLNNMLLRRNKKERAWAAKHPEMFVGSLCSFCAVCGLREGVVFSGPLPEGRAFKWAG